MPPSRRPLLGALAASFALAVAGAGLPTTASAATSGEASTSTAPATPKQRPPVTSRVTTALPSSVTRRLGTVARSLTPDGTTDPGGYVAVPAARIVDSRTGVGGLSGPQVSSTVTVQVTGVGPVPATDVKAVAVNVAAVAPTSSGYLSVYPAGQSAPTASTLNVAKGRTVANLSVVPVSPDGRIAIRIHLGTGATTHVLVDIAGYVLAGTTGHPGEITPLTPARVLDTRSGLGAPKGARRGGSHTTVTIGGRTGVPATGVDSVLLNLTATATTSSGYVAVHAAGTAATGTSSLNFARGQTVANLVVARVSPGGAIRLDVGTSGTVQLVADVVGYATAGGPSADGTFGSVEPTRVVDTRWGGGAPLPGGSVVEVGLVDDGGHPVAGLSSAVLTVTVTKPTAGGYVSVFAGGAGIPPTSNVNIAAGGTVANLVLAPVSADGTVDLYLATSGTAHLIVDITGVLAGPSADTTPPDPVTALTASATSSSSVHLGWTLPADPTASGVVVVRTVGATPASSPYDGTTVADVLASSFDDSGLAPGTTYTYAVATHDVVPNFSFPLIATVTTPPMRWTTTVVDPLRGMPSGLSCPSVTWCMEIDGAGRAQVRNGSMWSGPMQVVPATGGREDRLLTDVSCPVAGWCVALTGAGPALYRNGAWEAATPLGTGGWTAVDCASTSRCVAIGAGARASMFDGSTWSTPTTIAGTTDVAYADVACPTAAHCFAVGSKMTGAGYLATLSGSTWALGWISPIGTYPQQVSCSGPTFCMTTDSSHTFRTWKGSTWGPRTEMGINAYPGGTSLSCASSTLCMSLSAESGATRWNGSRWSALSAVATGVGYEAHVECPSTSMCLAVDHQGRVQTWNGTTWSGPSTFNTTSGVLGGVTCPNAVTCFVADRFGWVFAGDGTTWDAGRKLFTSEPTIDCPTPSFCVAVTNNWWSQEGVATWRTYSSGTWGALHTYPTGLTTLSCASPTSCQAFDSFGRAFRFTGNGWSGPVQVFRGLSAQTNVGCPAASFCMAVTWYGSWSRWNGSSWTAPATIPGTTPSDYGVVLDCPTTSMCLALDQVGHSYRWAAGRWSAVPASTTHAESRALQVSCASASVCYALTGNPAGLATFAGQGWTDQRSAVGLPESWAMDCPTSGRCLVPGGDSVAVSS